MLPTLVKGGASYWGYNKGFTEVPRDIPHDADKVSLLKNQITEIKANAFQNSTNAPRSIWGKIASPTLNPGLLMVLKIWLI